MDVWDGTARRWPPVLSAGVWTGASELAVFVSVVVVAAVISKADSRAAVRRPCPSGPLFSDLQGWAGAWRGVTAGRPRRSRSPSRMPGVTSSVSGGSLEEAAPPSGSCGRVGDHPPKATLRLAGNLYAALDVCESSRRMIRNAS